jgi:hypothetical protein
MAERTGCPVVLSLWSYVTAKYLIKYITPCIKIQFRTNCEAVLKTSNRALPPLLTAIIHVCSPMSGWHYQKRAFSNVVKQQNHARPHTMHRLLFKVQAVHSERVSPSQPKGNLILTIIPFVTIKSKPINSSDSLLYSPILAILLSNRSKPIAFLKCFKTNMRKTSPSSGFLLCTPI